MKTPSDQVFRLIKKMTAAEKRFMKIHFSSGKSHLTELFDYLNIQDEYDEKEVKLYFDNTPISKNLKVYKVQLMDMVMRSQVAYHAKRKVRSKIRMLLEEVDILSDSNLLDLADHRLKKAIEIGYENNETTLLVTALHHRLKMLRLLGLHSTEGRANERFEELESALTILNSEVKLTHYSRLLAIHSLCQGGVEEKFDYVREQMKTVPHQEKILAGNNLSAYLMAKIQAALEPDPVRKIELQEQLLEKFRSKGFTFIYSFAYRWEALNDLFCYYVKYGQAEKIKRTAGVYMRLLANPNIAGYMEQLYLPCYIEAQHNFHRGQSDYHISKFLQVNLEEVDQHWIRESVFCVRFYIYRMLDLMTSGESDKAKSLLSALQAATRTNNRGRFKDLNVLLDMIELIDHFESQNAEAVNYLLAGFRRKQKRGRAYSDFTISYYNFIKKMVKYPEVADESISTFRAEIAVLEPDFIYDLWQEFHLGDWLDSLGQSYRFFDLKGKKAKLKRTWFWHSYLADVAKSKNG